MIWPHNLFFYNNFSQRGNIVRLHIIETSTSNEPVPGHWKRAQNEICLPNQKIWCFSWRICAKLIQFWVEFSVFQTIKQLLKTKQNRQPQLACTWIQSPENDRENQKVSSACASRDQPRKRGQYTVYMLQFHFCHILYYILGNLY